ncbi:MAG: flavin reductase [Clostridia bacterium]|nr:flavin reductase [Clostridia bacterium]
MKAIYNISYGIFVLTAKDTKINGCIINTLMQATSVPNRITITVNKDNYTTQMIKNTGKFNVSILDTTTDFDLIKRFGFASGKDTNKFAGFNGFDVANNGIPYITKHVNSYISAKVVDSFDVGTHITFLADVEADVVLNSEKPATYAYYLENIKPSANKTKKNSYVCGICGYVYEGDELPDDYVCPLCKHGAEYFEKA